MEAGTAVVVREETSTELEVALFCVPSVPRSIDIRSTRPGRKAIREVFAATVDDDDEVPLCVVAVGLGGFFLAGFRLD